MGTRAPFVVDMKVLSKSELVIIPGKSGSNLFNGPPNTDMLALKIALSSKQRSQAAKPGMGY